MKKGFQNHQKENSKKGMLKQPVLKPLPLQHERHDKSPDSLSFPPLGYRCRKESLHSLFEEQRIELIKFEDGCTISFDLVATQLSECISQFLVDVPAQKRSISYIQGLLKVYVAVGYDGDGNVRVSRDKVHLILQDNYKDSFLERFFDILFIRNVDIKVVKNRMSKLI